MKGRILVAEDDPHQARILRLYLEREGHSVVVTEDGLRAVEEFRRRVPDLLILDIMMPNLDGHDVCRIVREESDVPILLLTARSGEDDVLVGLDLGADDYVTKPYSVRELVARIRAAARRAGSGPEVRSVIRIGDAVLDPGRYELRVAEQVFSLPRKEFELLQILMSQPGRIASRASLLERVWGYDWGESKSLDQHIRRLRRKLEHARAGPMIRTVRGVGYRLDPPVEPAAPQAGGRSSR